MPAKKKSEELDPVVNELTLDLQRTRADFENYRKRVEQEKEAARASGRESAINKLLPLVDDIERAISHMPDELKGNVWAESVAKLSKNLDKSLLGLNVQRIETNSGDVFDPDLHDAVQFDESDGDREIIASVLRSGYRIDGVVARPVMVSVTRQ